MDTRGPEPAFCGHSGLVVVIAGGASSRVEGGMGSIRVLLVDDNPTFLRLARRFLEEDDGISVVGALASGTDALTHVETLQPDVVLIDLAMPGLPGLAVIPRLRAARPDLGIIALTLLDSDPYRRAALEAGADDFVPKAALSADLPPAIRRVALANRTASGA